MLSNKQTIEEIAKQFLRNNNINFLTLGDPVLHKKEDKASIHKLDYWVVPYVYKVFQNEDAFVYINEASQEIMYILNKHGKTYIDGKRSSGEADDEESWDDL